MKVIDDFNDVSHAYNPSKNETSPILTKFELTKIIGMRVEQLSRGAPTLIDTKKNSFNNIHQIAYAELEKRILPFMIVRTLPNGSKEYWKLSDLLIPQYSHIY